MLQTSQLARQRLVRLGQRRQLTGHPGDLPVLGGDPLRLRADERDQLVARQLLRCRHPPITTHPPPNTHQRHAEVTTDITPESAAPAHQAARTHAPNRAEG